MGNVIEFPADSASRRFGTGLDGPREALGTLLILPVVRVERLIDDTTGGNDPEQGSKPGGGRRRRARS